MDDMGKSRIPLIFLCLWCKQGSSTMKYYQRTIEDVLAALSSSQEGISQDEAKRRLLEYGPNELKETKKTTPLGMLLDQFKDFMIIVLLAAAVISGIIGEAVDTIAIVVIVVLNAIIGFIQEYRAEKAMEALKLMASPTATVIRDGVTMAVPSPEVVPGDIVLLEAGVGLPADLRLIDVAQLKLEEAALTGESVPVEKSTPPLHEEMIPLGDRRNMAYKGTVVSYGRGKGVIVATGMETELGHIATMLQEEEEVKTPLQRRLAAVGQRLAIAALAICVIVFVIGIIRGESPVMMFLTAVSLAVAAIPEALPAVVTISLSLGAMKMVRQNVLVRKLPAVETLGSVTYICTDKTGTLTMNRMSVEELFVDGKILKGEEFRNPAETGDVFSILMKAMALSNDARVADGGKVMGDPTEVALFDAAKATGFDRGRLEEKLPRVAEIPFDSDRKCMTTVHRGEGGFVSFTKGGVEVIIEKADYILTSAGIEAIDKERLIRMSERMAADGLRVLAIGMRRWDAVPGDLSHEYVEQGLTILGFTGIMDPPRKEAMEAVALCKSAGIRPVMITGDHPITARAIAMRLGILDEDGEGMTGPRLERLSMEEFEEKVERIRVYARVAPEQKLKIVKGLQDKGEFVAMTGDGVNDAPALKRADIGIAMGITGTDVSKEASHMILLDDNFATIVASVRER